MRRRRQLVSTALSLSAAVLGAVALPASASAAPPGISISSVSPTGGNPAVLTVTVDDGNGPDPTYITSMTVHLFNSAMTDVMDLPGTDWTYPTSGSATDQTLTATDPISEGTGLGELPPGTYTMTVDATDADETDPGLPVPGTLAFVYTGTTLSVSPVAVSYGNQNVAVSGTLTGVAPGDTTDTQVPIGGEPVVLLDQTSGVSTPLATTSSDGTFQSATVPIATDKYLVTVAANGTMPTTSSSLTVNPTLDATKVSAIVTPVNLVYGKTTGMMTGVAQYQNGTVWTNLADSSVQVTVGKAKAVAVPTAANGKFTFTVSSKDGDSWTVLAGVDSLLRQSQATGSVHVAVPITVRTFAASLSTFGTLTASGCLQVKVPNFSPPGRSSRIEIQYAPGRSGPWKNLGAVATDSATSASCRAASESYFRGTLGARLANAYYRADYLGDINFQHTIGGLVHAWKYVTQVASVRVSPRSVKHGGKITVSGTLRHFVGSWKSYAKQQILIILKPKGRKSWFWIYKVTTNSRGQFSKKFVDPTTADWSAEYLGNKTHLASAGAVFLVTLSGGSVEPAAQVHPVSRPPAYPFASGT